MTYFTLTDDDDLEFPNTMVTFVSSDVDMNTRCTSFSALPDTHVEGPESFIVSIAAVSPSGVVHTEAPSMIKVTVADDGK